jgi:acyl carrier protein
MTDKIAAALKTYIAREITRQPDRDIDPLEPLLTSGLIDSFHLVDLALFVEDKFGVHIDDAELNAQTFDNLDQLVAFIRSRQ